MATQHFHTWGWSELHLDSVHMTHSCVGLRYHCMPLTYSEPLGQRRHIKCTDLQVGFLEQRTIRPGSYQAWCANHRCCKLESSVHHSTLRWHTDGHDALTLIQRGYHHMERDDHSVAQQMSLPVFCTLWIRIGYKNLKYTVTVCKSDFTTVVEMLIALFPLINWFGSSPLCQIPIYWNLTPIYFILGEF